MTNMKPDIKLLEPVEASHTTADEIATLIDDIGSMLPAVRARQKKIKALQNQLQPYADKMKTLTALVSAIEGHEADETFRRDGELFAAMIGKRCVVRTVTDPALAIKLLNKAEKGVAWRVITVALGKLDTYLTLEQRAQVITVDRGERPVVIVKKPCQEAG
jgi:hypothetical protein